MKSGYKQTDIGVLPAEWSVKLLGDCLSNRPSYGINAPAVSYSDRLPVYIRITDIDANGLFSSDGRVSVDSELSRNYYLVEGDIVFARTGASVGKSYRYDSKDGPLVFAGFLIRIQPDSKKLLPKFAAAYALTGSYWRWVRLMSMRSGQPGINGTEYSQLPIPVPPLYEQGSIVEVLYDVAELLNSLDSLIAKKRNLKQAAMQQLLTGQTRLPGFSGEWEVKRLGDLGSTYGGLTGKTKADFGNGDARYITFMNVMQNLVIDCESFDRVEVSQRESQNHARKGDLFFNGSSETPEEVALCAVLLDEVQDVYLNSFCFGFRFREDMAANGIFFAYYLRGPVGRELMKSLAQGSTRYNLSKVALLNSSLLLPTPPEQTAIAEVLTGMDAELAALEQRRNKTAALKQGMMQELLTGRTRLI